MYLMSPTLTLTRYRGPFPSPRNHVETRGLGHGPCQPFDQMSPRLPTPSYSQLFFFYLKNFVSPILYRENWTTAGTVSANTCKIKTRILYFGRCDWCRVKIIGNRLGDLVPTQRVKSAVARLVLLQSQSFQEFWGQMVACAKSVFCGL